MLKRILPALLSAAIALCALTSCGENVSQADTKQTAAQTASSVSTTGSASQKTASETTTTTTTTTTTAAPLPAIAHTSAHALYCVEDDRVLLANSLDKRISIASTTKMLTASLALKYLSPDTVITVGTEVYMTKPDSTVAGLMPGQRLTLQQLLYALLLPSGNDAAYVVAVNTARKADPANSATDAQAVSTFTSMMNTFAQQLGMTSSRFANPEGWDDANHYSTLSDMLKLTKYALSQPALAKVMATQSITVQLLSGEYALWKNTNLLLDPSSMFYLPGTIGAKTGTTPNAGCCLISAVKKNGKTYICAVMGCYTDADRYTASRALLQTLA